MQILFNIENALNAKYKEYYDDYENLSPNLL